MLLIGGGAESAIFAASVDVAVVVCLRRFGGSPGPRLYHYDTMEPWERGGASGARWWALGGALVVLPLCLFWWGGSVWSIGELWLEAGSGHGGCGSWW